MNPDNNPQNVPTPGGAPQPGVPGQQPAPAPGPAPTTPPVAPAPTPTPTPVDPMGGPTAPTPLQQSAATVHTPGSRKGLVIAVMAVTVVVIGVLIYIVLTA